MQTYYLVNRTCEPDYCPSIVYFDYAGHTGNKGCCNGELCNWAYQKRDVSKSSNVGVTGALFLLTGALLLGSQW